MKKTDYAGIDYGMCNTNINLDTGIRFGVIQADEVGQVWYDESEAEYGDMECSNCGDTIIIDDICPNCEADLESDFDAVEPVSFFYEEDGHKCYQSADDTDIFVELSPYYTYAQFCSPCAPGACYLMNELKPQRIWVSSYCNFAHEIKTGKPIEHECRIIPVKAIEAEIKGNIEDSTNILRNAPAKIMRYGVKSRESYGNNKCYCFGHDWFEEGKAPYTVYSIETNEIIKPE